MTFSLLARDSRNGRFGVAPAEAASMDPQHRLLRERGYEALHDAALRRMALMGSSTGVFLGFSGTEFAQVLAASPAGGSVYAATGFSCSVTCGRVSFALGLHGPCADYDTACSASLVTSHGTVRAVQHREQLLQIVLK